MHPVAFAEYATAQNAISMAAFTLNDDMWKLTNKIVSRVFVSASALRLSEIQYRSLDFSAVKPPEHRCRT